MPIEQRQHTRFSVEIPAVIFTKYGERQETVLQQISIGGCFTGWEENIFAGDEFRIEVVLPNGNRLPLLCKAVYRFENTGVGVRFIDITEFEQSLVAKIIIEKLRSEGMPTDVDLFTNSAAAEKDQTPRITDARQEREDKLERVMSSEESF